MDSSIKKTGKLRGTHMIKRLTWILLVAAILLQSENQRSSAAEARKRPNILLILSDDVGDEVLGCYGGTQVKTPYLDKLAKTGVRFTHCYAMPVCHPTRICLLTGKYPFRWQHPKWGSFPKKAESRTVASVMKRAGYRTAVAGKWQLTMLKDDLDHPHRLGFDEYSLFGWHEGPRYFQPLIWQNGKLRDDVKDRYGPDVYTDFLIDFMKRSGDDPFFAFYSMALCHDVTDDLDKPVPHGPMGRYESYDEMAIAMDRQVGKLVSALDKLKLREDTLILFTGDNGTPKRSYIKHENGKLIRDPVSIRVGDEVIPGGKGELTDAGTRVPFIANWKGTIAGKQVLDDLIDMSDFMPTIAEFANDKSNRKMSLDGSRFNLRLKGFGRPIRKFAFAEHRGKFWVRDQNFKLYSDGRFFHVSKDVDEEAALDTTALKAAETEAHERLGKLIARFRQRK